MISLKNKSLFFGVTIFCILALLFAYYVEYFLKHEPCNLCLIERIPYISTVILSFFVLVFNKYEKIVLIMIGLFFASGTAISFYHFGIEQGFFSESLVCDLDENSQVRSSDDLLKELSTKSISCKDVTFRIFGISLATINTVISFIISVIIIRKGLNYDKN